MENIELVLYWWKANAHTTTTMPTLLVFVYQCYKRELAVVVL